jgi:UDP-GlcNAc:undecaprenyl-phosphate GlcNAc-1-phosphate transferase
MFLILTLGALAVLMALALTPIVRDSIGRFFLDRPDGGRKAHTTAVPRVGGIAIVLAYLATFAIAFSLPFSYTYVLHKALPNILALTLVASVVFLTGVVDDLVGLTAGQKLIGIGGASVLAFFAGIHVDIPMLHGLPAWPGLGFALTVIWLIGCSNAFNLIDGMDGLAAGVGLVATVTMLIAALTQGNLPLALATMPLAGCLLGFLRYNFEPASVFLGDGGSLLIGFLIGCYFALWSEKSVTLVALTAPLLVLSIPLLDVLLSVSRRYLRNRPIFQADRGHIHHKLLERGLSPRDAVLIMYGICSVVAMLTIASVRHNQLGGLIVIVFCGAAYIGIRHLEYAEFVSVGRMFRRGRFRLIIDFESRLIDFQKALERAADVQECWSKVQDGALEFNFQGVRLNLDGQVFENFSSDSKWLWGLRISLPDAQYIDFFRNFETEADPLVLSAFVVTVESGITRCVTRCLAQRASREAEAKLQGPAELYYTAGATGAGRAKSGPS